MLTRTTMIAGVRALGKLLYWAAVFLTSLVLVVALIFIFESLDQAQLSGG